jgi:hypothetical protein
MANHRRVQEKSRFRQGPEIIAFRRSIRGFSGNTFTSVTQGIAFAVNASAPNPGPQRSDELRCGFWIHRQIGIETF